MSQARKSTTTNTVAGEGRETARFSDANTFQVGDKPLNELATETKKRRGPKPTGQGTPIQVRLQPDQLKALNDYIAASSDPASTRPEAIRFLVSEALNLKPIAVPVSQPFDQETVSAFISGIIEYRNPYFTDVDSDIRSRSPASRIVRAISALGGVAGLLDELSCGRMEIIADTCQIADMLRLVEDDINRAHQQMEQAYEQAIDKRNKLKEERNTNLALKTFEAKAKELLSA